MTSELEDLARGLIATDAARRVGWAKQFAAQHKIEGLQEENDMLWRELELLRRAYSRLLGFTQTLPGLRSEILDAELKAHFEAERTFRDVESFKAGVHKAHEHIAEVKGIPDSEAKEQRNQARQRQSEQKLRTEAKKLGHHATVSAVSGTESTATCSCGQEFTGEQTTVFRWRNLHLAEVVYGETPQRRSARAQRDLDKRVARAKQLLAQIEKEK